MIHIIHGSDTYRSRQVLGELINGAYGGAGADNIHRQAQIVEIFDADERPVHELAGLLQGGSLFDDGVGETVVVRRLLGSAELDAYVAYFEQLAEHGLSQEVFIYIDDDLQSIGRRKSARQAVRDAAKRLIGIGTQHHVAALRDVERPKWLIAQVETQFRTALQPAAAALLVRTSTDSWRLMTQLHKLAALSGFSVITPRLVQEHGEPIAAAGVSGAVGAGGTTERSIFSLLDAVANNKKSQALAEMHMQFMRDPASEFYILTMFLYQFRLMLSVRDAVDRGYDEVRMKKAMGLHPFVLKKQLSFAKRFSGDQLRSLFTRLIELNDRLKFSGISPRIQLEQFVLEL